VTAPYWLRLSRVGNNLTAATSPDGVAWTTYATFSPYMEAAAYIGLAVTSHNNGALCTATFDQIALTTGGPSTPPAAPSNLMANATTSSEIVVAWTDNSTDETGFQVERATAASGPFAIIGSAGAGSQ